MSPFKVKSRKLKEKYYRIFACNVIHSLKLAQTDAFQLYARESVFSLRPFRINYNRSSSVIHIDNWSPLSV